MADINELGLGDEEVPTNLDEAAEEFGYTPPQPGRYTFTLAQDLASCFEKIVLPSGDFLRANLRRDKETGYDARLTMDDGSRLSVSIDTVKFSDKQESKFAYLLKALGVTGTLRTFKDFGEALKACGGHKFRATLTYRGYNKNTKQRFHTGPERTYKGKDGQVTIKSFPRDPRGSWVLEFQDADGTLIRGFPELEQFKELK